MDVDLLGCDAIWTTWREIALVSSCQSTWCYTPEHQRQHLERREKCGSLCAVHRVPWHVLPDARNGQ